MRLASYLGLATCIGVGGYWLSADGTPVVTAPSRPAVRTAKIPTVVVPPSLPADAPIVDDEEITEDVAVEEIRGHATITDPAEFAMVFEVDGTTYLRLSAEERATAHGTPRLILSTVEYGEPYAAVVAQVTVGALPAELRGWANREVVVDGDCKARVIGFAEVSRVIGDASDPYAYDEDGERLENEPWTVDRVRESNVTLAAKLDRCTGTWARAADWSPATVVARIEAPALEQAALDDLIAIKGEELAASWKEQGGEGTWREATTITTSTWLHPDTNERWIFVQASKPGYCGEPGISAMAVYRAGADGTPHLATELADAAASIDDVVDLDGDGQPEFLTSQGDGTYLQDLADTAHESIYLQRHSYGCGC